MITTLQLSVSITTMEEEIVGVSVRLNQATRDLLDVLPQSIVIIFIHYWYTS